MDITEKMVSFQIIQNVINVKTTLISGLLETSNNLMNKTSLIKSFSKYDLTIHADLI